MSTQITYWNRSAQRLENELVYGEGFLRWAYETWPGNFLGELLFSRRTFSKLYGASQSSRRSARKIPWFIEQFKIPMNEYEPAEYRSFNDFFIRRFRNGMRPVVQGPRMAAFAEGRYLGWSSIREDQKFPVKGKDLAAEALLGGGARARPFIGGPLMIARLCPVDYHRFHYPDDGTTLDSYRLHGKYHSVNPLALQIKSDIMITNERHVSILETKHFGKLAYVEVGATCVGKIVQSHQEKDFKRGQEKGYFLFGGSTVVLLGEPGRWKPEQDILENTEQRREVLVRLGDSVAVCTTS